MQRGIVLGLTMGEADGIGPEIVLKSVAKGDWHGSIRFVLVGSRAVLHEQAAKLKLPMPTAWAPGSGEPPVVSAWDPTPGTADASPDAATNAVSWVRAAVNESLTGGLDGIVTAPVSKKGFAGKETGSGGHTEFIAGLTGANRYAMMLLGGGLRVVLATRHIPLRDVPKRLTVSSIVTAGELASQGLSWLRARKRRIAICALNPHGEESDQVGIEERTVISPAVQSLQKQGLDVQGPLAADSVFSKGTRANYGCVVAMYHDQGLAPLKALAFRSGVNLTLGLPILRTSPCHGTAYDIAGKGIADPSSMMNAIRVAARLASRRSPFNPTH